ncbi:hypothetical protein SALBM135S_04847 [Streptomyces alboniger]
MLIRLLRTHLRPYKKPIALLVLLQFLQTCASLYLPTLNADIIDNGVVEGDTGYILGFGGIMIAVTVVQMICNIGAVFYGARTASALGRDVRAAVFDRVQSFSAREMGRFGAPTLITRTTNDVQQVQTLALMAFTLMVSAPIMCVGGIVMALGQDVPLSGVLLVAVVPVLGLSVSLIVRRLRPLFRTMQERLDTVNRVLREQITGNRVIRAFVRDAYEKDRFRGANTDLTEVSARHRQAARADVPDRHDRREHLLHRGGVVRRPPHRRRWHADRRAHRVPRLSHADRDVRDDGHLHVHDGAARGGLRRAHRGGPGAPRAAWCPRPPRCASCAATATWRSRPPASATPAPRSPC